MKLVLLALLLLAAVAAVAVRNDTYDLETMNAHCVSTLRRIYKMDEVYRHAICTPMRTDLALQLRERKLADTKHLEDNFVEDFQRTADKYDLCVAPFEDELHRAIREINLFYKFTVRNLTATPPLTFLANQTTSFSISQLKTAQMIQKNSQINWPLLIVSGFILAFVAAGIGITINANSISINEEEEFEFEEAIWHSLLQTIKCAGAA